MASGVPVRSTARLALLLVAAILLANLFSAGMATLIFRRAVIQQGQRTQFLVEEMFKNPDAIGDRSRSQWALLMQSRERAVADMTRATHVVIVAEVISSSFGMVLGLVLFRVLRRLDAKERELHRTVGQLEVSNANLDAFAGRVAHDLRNALAPTRLASSLLKKSADAGPEVKNVAGILDRSSARMVRTIDALLEFSRTTEPNPGAVCDISAVVEGALEEVGPLALSLDVKLDAAVPPAFVRGTSGALHTLVANLLNNAVKFLTEQQTRQVTVRGRPEGTEYALAIADTGPGIPREAQARLFERFFRVPGSKVEGLGIGLATARQVAEAFGGSISVQSEPGQGATFVVRLPLAPTASVDAPAQ